LEKIINVGITGTGSLIGQGIIKSIKKSSIHARIRLVGFDYIPDTVGSYWCQENYVLPDIFKRNETVETWLERVIFHIRQNELQLLFIGIDFELPVFGQYKDYLEKSTSCFIVVSPPEVIRIANDKFLTAQFLREHNLPFPLSFTKEGYTAGSLSYPLVVKPRVGARSRGFNLVKSDEELKSALDSLEDPVIQECVGSMDTEYTCGVIFLEGKVQASIALLRTLKEGNTYTADYRKDTPKQIYTYLEQVATVLKPFGVVNFQLRLDKEGIPKIFEINPRHSGTSYMRALFGFNEVEYLICYLLKEPTPDLTNLKEGRAVRFYDELII